MAKESNFKNMTLTLFVVSFMASTSLGLVYSFTKGPIENAQIAKINNALSKVLPAFDNQPAAEKYTREVDGGTLIFYPATKGGEKVGVAIQTFTMKGFSGQIDLMVGFLADGSINAIEVVAHKETPGLGDKMETAKSNFSVQFKGKNPESFKLSVKKDGGDVDAITASTISSRAYCDAVIRAYNALKKEEEKNEPAN